MNAGTMAPIHRPALLACLSLSVGIVMGSFLPFLPWIYLAINVVILVWIVYRRNSIAIYLLICAFGILSIQTRQLLPSHHIAFFEHSYLAKSIEGIIASDIQESTWAQGNFKRFTLDVKTVNGTPWIGKINVELYRSLDWSLDYGQFIRIDGGKLHAIYDGQKTNGFSYRRYMQAQGIYWALSASKQSHVTLLKSHAGNIFKVFALKTREGALEVFNKYLAPREAGFIAAIVLGDRSHFPKDINTYFVNTGTAHILAISGMNMAIVTLTVFFIFKCLRLPRRLQILGTILVLFAYAFVSGWSASVVRACIMSSVLLASMGLEYEADAINSTGVAAFILLILDPQNLFDVGFQLSFAAVIGILLFHAWCMKPFKILPQIIGESMAISLAAFIATAPVIYYHFHMITPISILANIPIVPMADLSMILGLGLAATGWLPPLAMCFAGCIKALLSAMIICAQIFNQITYGHFII